MYDHNTSFAEIGRKLGVTRAFVCLVAKGKKKSKRVRAAISETIGLPDNFWDEMDKIYKR